MTMEPQCNLICILVKGRCADEIHHFTFFFFFTKDVIYTLNYKPVKIKFRRFIKITYVNLYPVTNSRKSTE